MQFLTLVLRYRACAAAILFAATIQIGMASADTSFRTFLESLWPDAQAAGVSRKTFDAAFAGLKPDYKLPDLEIPGRKKRKVRQAEFHARAARILGQVLFGTTGQAWARPIAQT